MKIEEALKFYREGRSIRRRSWQQDKKAFELYGVPYVQRIDVEAQDWEVVRKKVAWPEAWEAILKGKVVIVNDPNTSIKRIKKTSDYEVRSTAIDCWCQDYRGEWGWSLFGTSMPLRWLERTDFEIVEDE